MRNPVSYLLFMIFAAGLAFPAAASARIGVGVASGKIQVEDKLKPGIIYTLPSLTVVNTGDEASNYEVTVTYHEKQPQLRPAVEWFDFSPQQFRLEPGAAQKVDIRLDVPVKVEPGDYFAYLEAHPVKKAAQGTTSVGIAAAAKLYFTVVPANYFAGLYYKAVSYWKLYEPWTNRGAIVIAVILILLFFKKFFKVEVNLKKSVSRSESN